MENKSETSSIDFEEEEYGAPLLEKKIGDKAIIEQNYHEAIEHYLIALEKLKVLFDVKSNELAKNFSKAKRLIDTVGVPCHSNLAFCYLKQREWKKCIYECEKVLQIDRVNTKAFFRRCTAYIEMNDLKKANEDIVILSGLLKNSTELNALKDLIREKTNENNQRLSHVNRSSISCYSSCIFESVSSYAYDTMNKVGVVPLVKLAVDIGYKKPKSICAKGTEMIVSGYEKVKYVIIDFPMGIMGSCFSTVNIIQSKIGNLFGFLQGNKKD